MSKDIQEHYKMKITKNQLRRIIKEELSRLNENEPPRPGERGSADGGINSMSWESLWEHPMNDDGMDDVVAKINSNPGFNVSNFIDEIHGDRDDIKYLEDNFQKTNTAFHETRMEVGTIYMGTVDGVPIAIWDVMGDQTWMR